jgi:hypothetical protein
MISFTINLKLLTLDSELRPVIASYVFYGVENTYIFIQ